MTVITGTLALATRGNTDILDITGQVLHLVEQSGLRSGIVTVFCPRPPAG